MSELNSALGIASEEEFLKSQGISLEETETGGADKAAASSLLQVTAQGAEGNAASNEVKVSLRRTIIV